MEQRVSVIVVGVADVDRARDFYEGLGWHQAGRRIEDFVNDRIGQVAGFQIGGVILLLAERESLAARTGVADQSGWTGVTLIQVVDDPIDVDVVLAEARGGGATITQPACRTDRGGYCGVFVAPDGHAWEVLYDPDWILPVGSAPLRPSEGHDS